MAEAAKPLFDTAMQAVSQRFNCSDVYVNRERWTVERRAQDLSSQIHWLRFHRYWNPQPLQTTPRMIEQMILRPNIQLVPNVVSQQHQPDMSHSCLSSVDRNGDSLFATCSPEHLEAQKYLGCVKGTFVCSSVTFMTAVVEKAVAAVGANCVGGMLAG